jgi:hypothetical protein
MATRQGWRWSSFHLNFYSSLFSSASTANLDLLSMRIWTMWPTLEKILDLIK